MSAPDSVIEQLEWYHKEIESMRKLLDQRRRAYFDLDAEISRMESERSKLFRIAVNLTA